MKNLLFIFSLLLLTAATPQIGEKLESLQNQYVIVNKLHNGRFAEIFKVQDLEGELHVLKWFKPEEITNHSSFARFFGDWNREFEVGTSLNHPAIIKAQDKEDRYLILEHGKGKKLCKFNGLTCHQAVLISLQVIDAMKYAFSHQYCHINLSIDQILISEDFEVKIVDLAYLISFDDLKKHYEGSEARLSNMWVKQVSQVAGICMQVFDKVPLLRAERIDRKLAITKVVWELIEDFDEKKDIQFEFQFDLLSQVIRSFDN